MHDPAEMIRKIAELEKGLPAGNRPETLYARAALLQAETQAKLLFVLIDLSKNFDRFTDTLAMALTQPEIKITQRLDLVESILDEIHPELTPAKTGTDSSNKENRFICTKCHDEIKRQDPEREGKAVGFTCRCMVIIEGEKIPDFWVTLNEYEHRDSVTLVAVQNPTLREPGSVVDAEFDETKEQSDSRQKVSAPVSEEKLPKVDGLGEFDAEESKSSGDEAPETGDQR